MSVRPLVLQQDWGSLPVLRVRKTAGRFGLLLLPLALWRWSPGNGVLLALRSR